MNSILNPYKAKQTGAGLLQFLVLFFLTCTQAFCQNLIPTNDMPWHDWVMLGTSELFMSLITIGSVLTAAIFGYLLMRNFHHMRETKRSYAERESDLVTRHHRCEDLLGLDLRIFTVWDSDSKTPTGYGSLSFPSGGETFTPEALWPLERWMCLRHIPALEEAILNLRKRGRKFETIVETRAGGEVEVIGKTVGASAVVSWHTYGSLEDGETSLTSQYRRLADEHEALTSIMDRHSNPIWLRNHEGQFIWSNQTFQKWIGFDGNNSLEEQAEKFFSLRLLQNSLEAITSGRNYQEKLEMPDAQTNKVIDWSETPTQRGCAGFAHDISEVDRLGKALEAQNEFQQGMLDKLSSGLVLFTGDRRLAHFNEAFLKMFKIDPNWLASKPTERLFIQKLRSNELLPMDADFQTLRSDLLKVFEAQTFTTFDWFLPDQRRIKVTAGPGIDGGVVFIFEDCTQIFQMQNAYLGALKQHSETINHLKEGLAVFGSNGKLIEYNQSLAQLWNIDENILANQPHIESLIKTLSPLCQSDFDWTEIMLAATDLSGKGAKISGNLDLKIGSVLEFEWVPLPEGASLLTFVDQTETANVDILRQSQSEMLQETEVRHHSLMNDVATSLRSPSQKLLAYAAHLKEKTLQNIKTEDLELLNGVLDAGEQIDDLACQVSDLSALDSGQLTLAQEPQTFSAFYKSLMTYLQGEFGKRGLAIEAKPSRSKARISIDQPRIQQALRSLFLSIIPLTSPGEKTTITSSSNGKQTWVDFTFHASLDEHSLDRISGAIPALFCQALFAYHGGRVEIRQQNQDIIVRSYLPVAKADKKSKEIAA